MEFTERTMFVDQDAGVEKSMQIINSNWEGKIIIDNKLLEKKVCDNGYYIVSYNKNELKNIDPEYSSSIYSKLRSVVFNKNNTCLSFSPMKSITLNSFETLYPYGDSDVVIEQFVEGTMINLFYDENSNEETKWQISTKTKVGGYNSFYNYGTPVNKNFKEMFLETLKDVNLELDTLDKNLSYSFVMQHIDNRVVSKYVFNDLILVEAYKVNNEDSSLNEENKHTIYVEYVDVYSLSEMFKDTKVRLPERFHLSNYDSYSNILRHFNSAFDVSDKSIFYKSQIDCVIKGIIIKNIKTGVRVKSRNETYEFLAKLRGNQSKLEYHYLTLRKEKNIDLFLHIYPEFEKEFLNFRDKVHTFTQALHYNYYRCFKQHALKLSEIQYELRSHLFEIHKNYLNSLRGTGKTIQFDDIKDYVNNLPEARLMYSINFNMRKNNNKLVRQYASGAM
tara:strand:- start:1392 stop:2732 length:1341 start_codon:yes stop_codon:yes gene_type:complete